MSHTKNIFLGIATFLSATSFAQYDHNIQLSNGNTITNSVAEIDSISFSSDGIPTMHLKLENGTSNDYVLDGIDQVSFSGQPAEDPFPLNTVHCVPGGTEIVEVLNPSTGRTWMDRNLGASQIATAYNDEAAYGDLYQWGRFSDGHQCRDSETTGLVSETPQPDHDAFIRFQPFPYDWLSPQVNDLWQGIEGTNNPCPENFRLPTHAELELERLSWSSNNFEGAFDSPLKLTAAGYRGGDGMGNLFEIGSEGRYWSGSSFEYKSLYLEFNSTDASRTDFFRLPGFSIRCIKEIFDDDLDCPLIQGNYGDPCDDNDSSTYNDIITESCDCNGSDSVAPLYPEGTVHCVPEGTDIVEIFNPQTGKVWMDRNLGASQAATAVDDELSYGDLYQWGRFGDGHQCRFSDTTHVRSTSSEVEHGYFIVSPTIEYNWLTIANPDLWNISEEANNPCPSGFRVPTSAEFESELYTWESNDAFGALNSPLRLPLAGSRSGIDGSVSLEGEFGYYWTNNGASGDYEWFLFLTLDEIDVSLRSKISGSSVRCIRH